MESTHGTLNRARGCVMRHVGTEGQIGPRLAAKLKELDAALVWR